jgi:hypothetical protein
VADSNPKGGVTVSKPLARRIGRAVKKVEAQYWRPPDQRSSSYRVPFLPLQRAVVTTAIPTGTPTSESTSGRVTIYRRNDAGTLAAAETGQMCRNAHTLSASIAVGKTVTVWWDANAWSLVAADC